MKYEAYKDSGVEWLGEVPAHWRTKPLKYVVSINKSVLPENTPSAWTMRYIDIGAVGRGVFVESPQTVAFGEAPSRARRRVRMGDTIVSTVRTYLQAVAHIEEDDPDLIASTGFAVVTPGPDMEPRFLYYLLTSPAFIETVTARSVGVSYPAITASDFADIHVWYPPLAEQRAIVAYLDRKTAEIDGLVARKRRLIALLREQRTAVVSRAVTKGLDPAVPMKDSGVEWLGEVPAHWAVGTLRRFSASVSTGATPSGGKESEDGQGSVDWVTPADFGDRLELRDTKRKVTEGAVRDREVPLYPKGTVMLVGIGATLGKTGILTAPASANQQVNAVVFTSRIVSEYGAYFLAVHRLQVSGYANVATLPILNQAQTKSLPLLAPPVEEQAQILTHVRIKFAEIDALIRREEELIRRIGELRTALVSEAVTGTRDVRATEPTPETDSFAALLDRTRGAWTEGDGLDYQTRIRAERDDHTA